MDGWMDGHAAKADFFEAKWLVSQNELFHMDLEMLI
jgi:hypothetical protein